MMKLKKLFALALAGVMALALLTGCGDKPGDKPEDTLRAEALADIINVQRGVNITCEADPQLSEAAERYTQVSSGEGSINDLTNAIVSYSSQSRTALLKTIGIDPNTTNKQVIFYFGEDRGSDDPVKQAIDLCNNYRQVLPKPDGSTWPAAKFLASSYRVGFGRWTDDHNIPRLFVIMVGDIPGRS